jgi:hypothetical protein
MGHPPARRLTSPPESLVTMPTGRGLLPPAQLGAVHLSGLWRSAASLLPSHPAAPQVIAATAPNTTYV